MQTIIMPRLIAISIFMFATSFTFGQDYKVKIKAKWIVNKFECEKNTPEAIKAQKEIEFTYLTFGDELLISKKIDGVETVIKRGLYSVSGSSLTLGKDEAIILELSENKMSIKISGQGILHLSKTVVEEGG